MIVEIALMLSIIVVFAFVGPILVEKGKAYFDGQDCQTSIDRAIQLNSFAGIFGSKITCKTQERSLSGTDSEVKASIAQSLETCWTRWHQGQDELFSGDGVFCDICARFEESGDKTVSGWKEYFSSRPAKNGQPLSEFFTSNNFPTVVMPLKADGTPLDSIETNHPYVVVFRYGHYEDVQTASIHLRPHTKLEMDILSCKTYPVYQQSTVI